MNDAVTRDKFLHDLWQRYPAFPDGFDRLMASRFHQLAALPMADKVLLSPTNTPFSVSKTDLTHLLRENDWVVVRNEGEKVREIFLLTPALDEPLSLSSNSEIQAQWFQFLDQVRLFFNQRKFQQAFTPTLVSCPGTEPFIDLFSSEILEGGKRRRVFLTTSPEIHLKKMLSSGYRDIFEIKNCFRNNETSERHRTEFVMLEWYRSFVDLEKIIQDCQELIAFLSGDKKPFIRKSMAELFKEKLQFELTPKTSIEDLKVLGRKLQLPVEKFDLWDDVFYFIFIEKIEPFLDSKNPLILEKYPPSQAAFARLTEDGWGDRFEIYWKGLELGNAFHELNDPQIQQQRFEEDLERKRHLGKEVPSLDPDFMRALRSGMPPSSGIAMGLERLFMALHDIKDISHVRVF